MQIRLAIPDDAANIEGLLLGYADGLYDDLFRAYLKSSFSNDYRRPTFILAFEDEALVGTATFSEEIFTVETWGISCVYVREDRQNRGIGRQLVEECLNQIKRNAGKTVTAILNTYAGKTRLYDKIGFTIAGYDHTGGSYMIKKVDADEV